MKINSTIDVAMAVMEEEDRYCPQCGRFNVLAKNFCRYCGSKYSMTTIEAAILEADHFKKSTVDRRIPKKVQQEVWSRDNGRCVKCGSRERLEYDHIIPVSKGGTNAAENVELLCQQCNQKKHDKIGD